MKKHMPQILSSLKHLLLPALFLALLLGAGEPTETYAQCTDGGYEYNLVCTNGPNEWGSGGQRSSETNGCLSGYGYVEQTQVSNCGGGEVGGGGGGEIYLADLTASAIAPTTAPILQAQTFTATITNAGSDAAGASVTRFQRASDASGTNAYEVGSVPTQDISAGASRNVSFSHTFAAAGTYYLRACADSNSAVFESDEANNCGSWTAIVVAPPAPTVDLTATPESITSGASSIVRWVSANADICSSTQFDTLGATSGQVSVSPGETTLYSIVCRNGGSGASGTYRYAFTDTSDLACPITDVNKAYSGLPTCPVNPGGKACTTGPCKRNTIREYPGICTIETDVYNCVYSSGTSAQQAEDSVTVTVTASGTDLTAGSAAAPGAARGRTVSVTAPILNLGGTAAGASRAYYELVAPSPKQNASGAVPIGAIAAASSQNASFNYTFSTSGNYQVRFCADWYGEVPETNEGNNCGPWTDIAIPETPISDGVSCSVSSTSVTTGQSVTYTAYPSGAATNPYTWTPSDGVGTYGSGATASRTFTVPGSYGMQVAATNAASPANCPVVTVGAGFCVSGTPDLTITATPTRVRSGQASLIEWSASGVVGSGATCTVSGPNMTTWTSTVSPAPQCSTGSSQTVTINTQSTYTLTCGAYSESVTVNVIPNFQEF